MVNRSTLKILFKRGPSSRRLLETPRTGEPLWVTDKKVLYVGDDATPGGVLVTFIPEVETWTNFSVDGTDRVRTLSKNPDPACTLVFVNGMLQTNGADADYVVQNSTVNINYPVKTNDRLTVVYRAL